MIKLEMNEVALLFQMLSEAQIQGKDAIVVGKLLEKLQNELVNAVIHYQRTGKHKQVKLRYDPETRTEFNFSSWKHERDHDSVRAILPEDIIMSGEGHFYVDGKDNRYNLRQFSSQHENHQRSYRLDRIID